MIVARGKARVEAQRRYIELAQRSLRREAPQTTPKMVIRQGLDRYPKCCQEYSESDSLERWMAEGFWFLPSFIREWTTHSSFPRVHEAEYYQRAYERLDDLAYWFFIGDCPYLNEATLEPM